MVWPNNRTQTLYTAWADYPCVIESSGRKFKISIPEGLPICGAGMITPEAVYYWHLGSDPVSGCMGIGECKQTLIYKPADLPPAEQR